MVVASRQYESVDYQDERPDGNDAIETRECIPDVGIGLSRCNEVRVGEDDTDMQGG